MKNLKYLSLFLVLIMISGFLIYYKTRIYPVVIVIPNEYEGYVTIIEDKKNYDLYYGAAWENYNTLEYHVGDDRILRVESIRHFLEWPDNISVGYEWVEPVVYYQDKDNLKFSVFSDLFKISETKYRFWVGAFPMKDDKTGSFRP
ncbi:MAG: hypothetical protein GY714_01165 [Desulfobacterales bacterium]|nr:hypothetical protein [Desulfobacterales bacterium]MCP4158432.1 hypothetical protein [Deltaproteobacteria bacterium]